MVELLLDLTTTARSKALSLLLVLLVGLSACSTREVIVDGSFPRPVLEPLPLSIGVLFTEEFKTHELIDDGSARGEASWRVSTGEAQVEFWSVLLPGAFANVVYIEESTDLTAINLDAIFIPTVEDIQYTIPLYTNVNVFEIWMRYRLQLVEPEKLVEAEVPFDTKELEAFADWSLTAYGKTPEAFLTSQTDAVNAAAVMALRDAGANFITSFGAVPAIETWLSTHMEAE